MEFSRKSKWQNQKNKLKKLSFYDLVQNQPCIYSISGLDTLTLVP